MNLQDLGLNRFLYKDVLDETPDSSIFETNSNITNEGGDAAGSSTEPGSPPITSVILQSSPSDDRIEINPDDTFKAYNSGNVVVLIDKNGIVADNLTVENETIENSTIVNANITNATIDTADIDTANIDTANIDTANIDDAFIDNAEIDELTVNDYFFYAGYQQPQVFGGTINFDGSVVSLPPGWSVVHVSTGLYQITHNLNNINYNVALSAISGHFRGKTFLYDVNDFSVSFQQTVYGTATFPVTGGGGGSVDVDGVRIPPNEEQVDVTFGFVLTNNLP